MSQERIVFLIEKEVLAFLAEHQKVLFTPEDGGLKIAQNASFDIRWRILKRRNYGRNCKNSLKRSNSRHE